MTLQVSTQNIKVKATRVNTQIMFVIQAYYMEIKSDDNNIQKSRKYTTLELAELRSNPSLTKIYPCNFVQII